MLKITRKNKHIYNYFIHRDRVCPRSAQGIFTTMNSQQTTDTQAILRAAFTRLMDGSPSEKAVAELTEMGTSEESAQEVVAHAVVILGDPRVREVVASIGKDGTAAAHAWELLISSGVDRDAAQALVAEVVERRGQIEQKHRLGEEDWKRKKREANLDYVRSRRKHGWSAIRSGGLFLTPALLVFAYAVRIGAMPYILSADNPLANLRKLVVFVSAVVGVVFIGMGIFRLRDADTHEKRLNRTDGGG